MAPKKTVGSAKGTPAAKIVKKRVAKEAKVAAKKVKAAKVPKVKVAKVAKAPKVKTTDGPVVKKSKGRPKKVVSEATPVQAPAVGVKRRGRPPKVKA